ncbi:hypothetical protein MZK49_28230 [Ensifer sesbaniae]|uniref:hypothetical protein n=1 Tax=Ensifer sesbaniae TaxID=1214071 RepID=UPI00156909F8|nr:hypothetical protein [Ensifer sesbaniae]MCK3780572.1 hypothetical protein [Ensifer sesbaniae]
MTDEMSRRASRRPVPSSCRPVRFANPGTPGGLIGIPDGEQIVRRAAKLSIDFQ